MQEATASPSQCVKTRGVSSDAAVYPWLVVVVGWSAMILTFVDRHARANVPVSSKLRLPGTRLGVFVATFARGCVFSDAIGGIMTVRVGPRVNLAAAMPLLGAFATGFRAMSSLHGGSSLPLSFVLLANGP